MDVLTQYWHSKHPRIQRYCLVLLRCWLYQDKECTVKVHLFVGTNVRGFYKMYWFLGSWIRAFKHYRRQLMGKLYFVEFLFSWLKWTTKSAKIWTPWLIKILQYLISFLAIDRKYYYLLLWTLSPSHKNVLKHIYQKALHNFLLIIQEFIEYTHVILNKNKPCITYSSKSEDNVWG
jgi:hypothetical protein